MTSSSALARNVVNFGDALASRQVGTSTSLLSTSRACLALRCGKFEQLTLVVLYHFSSALPSPLSRPIALMCTPNRPSLISNFEFVDIDLYLAATSKVYFRRLSSSRRNPLLTPQSKLLTRHQQRYLMITSSICEQLESLRQCITIQTSGFHTNSLCKVARTIKSLRYLSLDGIETISSAGRPTINRVSCSRGHASGLTMRIFI